MPTLCTESCLPQHLLHIVFCRERTIISLSIYHPAHCIFKSVVTGHNWPQSTPKSIKLSFPYRNRYFPISTCYFYLALTFTQFRKYAIFDHGIEIITIILFIKILSDCSQKRQCLQEKNRILLTHWKRTLAGKFKSLLSTRCIFVSFLLFWLCTVKYMVPRILRNLIIFIMDYSFNKALFG